MSFVRNILNKMSASEEKDAAGDLEDYDDTSEDTSTESEDTGIFTAVNSLSDFESAGHVVDADCSAISNFFGYWYVNKCMKTIKKVICFFANNFLSSY